jgi:cellulose synthase (UDP-forming)
LVNVAWVIFDLVVMSILVRAVLYKGYEPAADPAAVTERNPDGV